MGGMRTVWLVSNGDYWRAAWGNKPGQSESLGHKSKLSRRAALKLCRNKEIELRTKDMGKAPKLSAWLTQYAESRTDVKKSTRNLYRDCGRYLTAYFTDDPAIDRITRRDAAEWNDALSAGKITATLNEREQRKPKNRRVWQVPKLSTVRKHVRAAKLMFGEAARRDLILFDPFDRLNGAPPKPLKKWRQVTRADLDRILDACPNDGWRALFALARLNALRLSEALSLNWTDLDWSGNRMTVNEDIEAETTKQAFRVPPIEPSLCLTGLTDLLQGYFDAAPDGAVKVCVGVDAGNVRRRALAILKASGVGVYAKPFHTLRKCRVSELALVYPQGVVEDWCGHDEAVSRRHYQRVPDELYAPIPKPITSKITSKRKGESAIKQYPRRGSNTRPAV